MPLGDGAALDVVDSFWVDLDEASSKDEWGGSGSPMVQVPQVGSSSTPTRLDDENWVQRITRPLKSVAQSKGLVPALFLKREIH